MANLAPAYPSTSTTSEAAIAPDRRRYRRFALTLLGRFMRADKSEFPCKLVDISVGGVSVMSPVEVEVGEKVVAYFDTIGGLEGTIVRLIDGGFAMELIASQHKRDKLASQITWLINRSELDTYEGRRHERIPTNKTTTLKLVDDIVINVRVIDISMSGASIVTDARPAVGSHVQLGRLRARVARHHAEGVAVEFLDVQQADAVRRYFG